MKARLILVTFFVTCASTAIAAVLPIDGAYGNATGCAYFMTGAVNDDDLLLLTGDTFASIAVGCDFDTLTAQARDSFTVSAVCSSDSDESKGLQNIVVTGRRDSGYTLMLEGRDPLGPMTLCPGTENMNRGRGEVQV